MKLIETVGILGLGKMGAPIAGHLVSRGFKVIGYDPVGLTLLLDRPVGKAFKANTLPPLSLTMPFM